MVPIPLSLYFCKHEMNMVLIHSLTGSEEDFQVSGGSNVNRQHTYLRQSRSKYGHKEESTTAVSEKSVTSAQ